MAWDIIAWAAVIAAAASAAGASYTIVSSEAAKEEQDKLRKQFSIGNNQDPAQQLAARLNAATLDAQHATEQAAQIQAQAQAQLAAEQKKEMVLLIGGGVALFLLTRK